MKKIKIIEVATEYNIQGTPAKTLGLFIGSIDQAVEYCYNNGLKATYNYFINNIEVIDVSDLTVKGRTVAGFYNTVKYYTPEEVLKEKKCMEAMAKLSDEDKELLGLTK